MQLQAHSIAEELDNLEQIPGIIIGVPDGATKDASRLQQLLKIPYLVSAHKIGTGPTKRFDVPDLRYLSEDEAPKVLLVDDVGTTWGSFRKMTAAVEAAGGYVLMWSVFADRSGMLFDQPTDLQKISVIAPPGITQWPAEECVCEEA